MSISLRSMRSLALIALVSAFAAVGCNSDTTTTTTPSGNTTQTGTGTSDSPLTVFITNSTYSPNPFTVKVGQFVNFKNNDSIVHSATFDDGSYDSGDIPADSAHDVPVQMTTVGTFTFHCRFHGEKGSIIVTQ